MHHDHHGIAVTTDSAEAVRLLDAAVSAMLAQRADAASALQGVLLADPLLAAAHCLAGFQRLLAARQPLAAAAAGDLAAARAALGARGGTTREKGLVRALAAWQERGSMWDAADELELLLLADPHDVLALRLSHAIRFMLGDAPGMRLAIERVLSAWGRGVPDRGFVLGCYAFALEETGELDAAEHVGRGAVALEPADVWGAHAVAHVFEHQERPHDGLAWLAGIEPGLGAVGCFRRHVFWHRALFHLRLGEADAVLALYDRRIRDEPSEEVRDVMNAASLLWRLRRRGVDVGERWEELANLAERRIGDHAWAFADLHYVLCLAADGRSDSVQAMLASIRARMLRRADTQGQVYAQVGLAVAEAAAAAGLGAADGTVDGMLAAAAGRVPRLGGSNAQRALVAELAPSGGPSGWRRPAGRARRLPAGSRPRPSGASFGSRVDDRPAPPARLPLPRRRRDTVA